MSQAFIRESDEQSLSDIAPTMHALINFLTRENGGIRVYEKQKVADSNGNEVHVMSNGLSYRKDRNGKWEAILPSI
jgi:hypothetical protein